MRFDDAPGERVRIAGNTAAGGHVGFGDAWVLVVDFSGGVRAQSVLAYGQATSLASPHSADQLRIFAEHGLRPVWFREPDVRAHLEREYRP